MYGTGGLGVGSGLAATGVAYGSKLLAGVGLLFAGVSFIMLARKSSPVKP